MGGGGLSVVLIQRAVLMSGISTALWRGPITQNRDPKSGVKTVSMSDVLGRAQVLLGGESQG